MSNGNGPPTVRVWQVLVGQLPWFLTVVALGGWWAARFEARLSSVEASTARIEARQQRASDEKLEDMRAEVERLRKTVGSR